MPPHSGARGLVLIIDPDKSIQHLIAALLRRCGFRTICASEITNALLERPFDVIVRDVNLAPLRREASLQELRQTPPEIMARSVVTTTGPVSALKRHKSVQPFAIVSKPFDIIVLLEAIRRCRDGHIRTRAGSAPETDEDETSSSIETARLERFVRSVPHLRALLRGRAISSRALLLRSAVRRTVCDLSQVLSRAAREERDGSQRDVVLAVTTLIRGIPAARSHWSDRAH